MMGMLSEETNCALKLVPSPQLEFLSYTCNVAVWNDSLCNKFHIYYK